MIGCFNIVKSFHGTPVIKGISIEIKNGMITSLVGKNGAGKSTLIGLIMDYYRCDSGEVKKGAVSVMPDADNMYSDWTGLEFLKFISKLKKTDVSYAINLSKELGLYKNLNSKISGYSFGMKKKLSFIQCAIGDFDAYIFDEPTSGVDVPSALKMLEVVRGLKNRGSAILLTSHNIDELERVSDYIYIIDSGEIIDSGTVKDLINPDSTEKEVYIIHCLDSQKLFNDASIKFTKRIVDENHLEIDLSQSTLPNELLRLLVNSDNTVYEFYKKKRSLIETVYQSE